MVDEQGPARGIERRNHQYAEQCAGESHGEGRAGPCCYEGSGQVDVQGLLAERTGVENAEVAGQEFGCIEPLRRLIPPQAGRNRVQAPHTQTQHQGGQQEHKDGENGASDGR